MVPRRKILEEKDLKEISPKKKQFLEKGLEKKDSISISN